MTSTSSGCIYFIYCLCVANSFKACYFCRMERTTKTPVFFIATKIKEEPAVVNFYTKEGEKVAFKSVKKEKTIEGVRFYATSHGKK